MRFSIQLASSAMPSPVLADTGMISISGLRIFAFSVSLSISKSNQGRTSILFTTRRLQLSYIRGYDILDEITDPEQYDILFKRYILSETWKQIAEEMGCSQRHCMRLSKTGIN